MGSVTRSPTAAYSQNNEQGAVHFDVVRFAASGHVLVPPGLGNSYSLSPSVSVSQSTSPGRSLPVMVTVMSPSGWPTSLKLTAPA